MKKFLAAVIVVLLISMAGVTQAAIVDFESTALGTYNSLSFSDFAITFTGGTGYFDIYSASPGPPISGNALTSWYQNSYNSDPFLVTFNIANVYSFKIGMGDYNSDEDHGYLRVYDASWNLLGETFYTNPDWLNGGDYLSVVTNTPIKYAKFGEDSYYAGAVYWDNLTYTTGAAVPEPATMLLLGLGLVGIAGFRKKMK